MIVGAGGLAIAPSPWRRVRSEVAALAAWFEEDWSAYADRTELEQTYTVNVSDRSGGEDGDVSILSGLTGTPGGFTKAVSIQYDDISGTVACGSEPGIGIVIPLPDAATAQPTEIWVQVPIRLRSNYLSDHGCGGTPEHKFLFLFDENTGGRWNVMMGTGGDELRMYPNAQASGQIVAREPGSDPASLESPRLNIFTELVGQGWATLRIRAKLGAGDGRSDVWLDGVKVLEDTGLTTDATSDYFARLDLGANMNHRPGQTVQFDYGPVKAYINDPGWS